MQRIFFTIFFLVSLKLLFANDISVLSKAQQNFLKTMQEKIERKDYENAIKELEKEIKSNSEAKNYFSYFLLANAYYGNKNINKALENFLLASNFDSSSLAINYNIGKIYYEKNDFKNAEKYFKTAMNNIQQPTKELFQILANCYIMQNDLILAEQIINKAIFYFPDEIQFRLLLVQIKIAQEEYNEAEALCKSFLKIFPSNDDLYLYLAKLKIINKNYDEAISELTKLTYLTNQKNEAFNLLAQLYSQKGMYKETIQYLTELKKNKTLTSDELFILAKSYYNIGKYAEALNCIEKISDKSEQYEIKILKCKILYEIGNYNEAIKELEKLKNKITNNGEIYLLNGLCYIKINNYNAAEKELEIAKLYNTTREIAYATLGEIKIYKGEIKEAINLYNEALTINPINENYQKIINTLSNWEQTIKK
ncbi:MAG TPA: tetratricopeptide repeat protein [bacterium]|nr:tetratricopeptide repeat protein [bacterium]HOL47016.1 tetratricopeptide repeat protein [bacterium]HPQ18482.1 tetratricopeptide repeat protein [bacterium]